MHYPTIEEVDNASRYQICKWWRFLPSPGSGSINKTRAEFDIALDSQVKIMNRIAERLKELGGFTPEISKSIGW